MNWSEAKTIPGDPHERDDARGRRAGLLVAALALPTLLLLAGVAAAWPLYALPLALAVPLAGVRGLLGALACASLVAAFVSGRPGADGAAIGMGLGAFALTGLAVGAGHQVQVREGRRIASLSLLDHLTGIHNYAFFADALPRECRRAERYGLPLSLVIMDLDRFKAFNDRWGHEAGNRLLAAVGEVIRANLRGSDTAARFGGEEFALIVPGPAGEAMEAAERVRAAIAAIRIPVAGGASAGTTVSAGVAEFAGGAEDDSERLLERADRALYHSKQAGRDRVSLSAPEHRWAAAS